MDLRLEFGLRIKNLREKKGYSIEFLANVSNLDRTYISEIEKGKRNPSLLVIEKLAKGLEVEILDFFKAE